MPRGTRAEVVLTYAMAAPILPLPTQQPSRRPAQRPPPRPDLDTTPANFMRAMARIAVALGLNAIDATDLAHEHVRRTWPTDRVAPLVLRAAMTPTTTTTAAALALVARAFPRP